MGKRFNIAPVIMFLLFAAVIGMGVYIFLDYKKDIENNTVPSYLTTKFKVDDTKEIEDVIKEYSYDNNLANKDNIDSWKMDNIQLIGHLEDDESVEIYKVNGSYSCKDLSSDCVYVEQVIDKSEGSYGYQVFVTVKKNDDGYTLLDITSQVETVTTIVSDDKDGIRGTGYTNEELILLYKTYLISNGYVLKPDLNEWNVTLKYVGKNKEQLVFFASNSFSCLSGTYTCIYQAQVGENPFVFDIAVMMEKDIDGIYKFVGIDMPFNVVVEETAMEEDIDANKVTRADIAGKIKDFYLANGQAVESNLKVFDVSYVTYLGDLKGNPGMYGMKATITYACNDGMKTCVGEDVKRDPTSKDYTFSVAFDVLIDAEGNYNISKIYPVGNTEHINVNNIVLR